MSNIKQITFDRTIKTLAALGVEYIIKDSEGVVHTLGTLCLAEAPPTPKRQKRSGLPHGDLTSHVATYMEKMVVGDVVCVPIYEGGNLKSLHSAVSSYAGRVWGNGNGTTHKDTANNCIEVMRVG
jgi:hypothetical protein